MDLPPEWKIDSGGLRLLGVALLALAVGYLVLCAVAGDHVWRVRGHDLETPSAAHGAAAACAVVHQLVADGRASCGCCCNREIAYPQVLAVLLVAAVAGVITHVPAGLGVLEAVFVALLGAPGAEHGLSGAPCWPIAALYYLLPLALASAHLPGDRTARTAPAWKGRPAANASPAEATGSGGSAA